MVRRDVTVLHGQGVPDNVGRSLPNRAFGNMANAWSDEEVRVLVGWTAEDYGTSMVLRLETVTNMPQSDDDVLVSRMVLNKDQAVQLGNILFELSGRLPPKTAKPPLLDRMLARRSD